MNGQHSARYNGPSAGRSDRNRVARRVPTKSRERLRILVAAHCHPEISKGGAEIAAHQLFSQFRERSDCEAWFIACDRTREVDRAGVVLVQPFSEHEYIYTGGEFDWFKFSNPDHNFPEEFSRLLEELKPDIVHFHHFVNFGVEVFLNVRRTLPHCKIFLTLHEYLAICHHYGQMVTNRDRHLCYESKPISCQRCFPEFSRSDFFLRNLYIGRFFDLIDGFIAPSRFLATRYVAWGLPPEKMHVIENVVRTSRKPPKQRAAASDGVLRIGFFGQISALKGMDLVCDAAELLVENNLSDIVFEVFGDHRNQPPEFQTKLLERLKSARNLHFHGPYDSNHVDELMQSVDAVLMASIWWENSPVVIQEAFRNCRPVICPDIGGMAEKVRDWIDGVHFRAGSAVALAKTLKRLASDRRILKSLCETIAVPPSPTEIIETHLSIYRTARAMPQSARPEIAR